MTQFSLVIGLYLSAMGCGAWLSRRIETRLAERFLEVELAVALVGGCSAPVLFLAFAHVANFQILLLVTVFAIGTLVGLEIPLLMNLLEGRITFRDLVSRVLTFDYIGALVAALLFPLLLVPWGFAIHFLRRYLKPVAPATRGETPIVDSLRTALASNQETRSHLKLVGVLYAIMIPLLALAMRQLHAGGKVSERELTSMAIFFGVVLLVGGIGIAARYFVRLQPQQKLLNALLAELAEAPR